VKVGKIEEMIGLGVEFWNDSCDPRERGDAVEHGGVGAASNGGIVRTMGKGETWTPGLRRLEREHRGLSDEALAWKWVEAIAVEASRLLLPVYERTRGEQGFLNVQVDPTKAREPEAMIAHARQLASLAPNVAVKIPLTREGLVAIEALTADGIRTNATVSFSVSQAVAAAEAMERGLAKRRESFRPYVTIMVGRVADHLKAVQEAELRLDDPGATDWAGIAVLKKAHQIFRERGLRPALVAAAYRHRRQWSELVGDGVIQSIPHKWWKAFDASDVPLSSTLEEPVAPPILDELTRHFPEFVRAYDERGMRPEEFASYGASVATLKQFESGYRALVARVSELREGAR